MAKITRWRRCRSSLRMIVGFKCIMEIPFSLFTSSYIWTNFENWTKEKEDFVIMELSYKRI
ncbi:hypothetical protein LOAG_14793, partial [Loa loa]